MTAEHHQAIAENLTYGEAAAAVAQQALENHGLAGDPGVFAQPQAFNQLLQLCPFLQGSMEAGLADTGNLDPGDILESIVTFVNADLHNEQLMSLSQAITSISQSEPEQKSIRGILETIRLAADSINDAPPEDEEARKDANQRAAEMIDQALQELEPMEERIRNIRTHNEMLKATGGPGCQDTSEENQENILLNLEGLAFQLGQDRWATAHGFQEPQSERATPAFRQGG